MSRSPLDPVGPRKRLRPLGAAHRTNLYTVLRNDAMRRADPTAPVVGMALDHHVAPSPINGARVVAWGAWLLLGTLAALPYLKTLI